MGIGNILDAFGTGEDAYDGLPQLTNAPNGRYNLRISSTPEVNERADGSRYVQVEMDIHDQEDKYFTVREFLGIPTEEEERAIEQFLANGRSTDGFPGETKKLIRRGAMKAKMLGAFYKAFGIADENRDPSNCALWVGGMQEFEVRLVESRKNKGTFFNEINWEEWLPKRK